MESPSRLRLSYYVLAVITVTGCIVSLLLQASRCSRRTQTQTQTQPRHLNGRSYGLLHVIGGSPFVFGLAGGRWQTIVKPLPEDRSWVFGTVAARMAARMVASSRAQGGIAACQCPRPRPRPCPCARESGVAAQKRRSSFVGWWLGLGRRGATTPFLRTTHVLGVRCCGVCWY